MLRRGERLHTVVYTGSRETDTGRSSGQERAAGERARTGTSSGRRPDDTLTHIFGCPYCYPPNDQYPRYCPVCERRLGEDDYIVARMFSREPRSHVHVLGCTQCRGPGSKARR
jgi:hypothetical protein